MSYNQLKQETEAKWPDLKMELVRNQHKYDFIVGVLSGADTDDLVELWKVVLVGKTCPTF